MCRVEHNVTKQQFPVDISTRFVSVYKQVHNFRVTTDPKYSKPVTHNYEVTYRRHTCNYQYIYNRSHRT
jgi:hypothetical protein